MEGVAYQHVATFDAPIEEVFSWHARPGAIRRLLPPWQPVKVAQEAYSLEDGVAVLSMPAGISWRARHEPTGYVAGRRFTDVLDTAVLGQALAWRHVHSFAELPGDRTQLTDEVRTRLPDRFLEQMFGYRARQIVGDLAAHGRWGTSTQQRLTVAMTGSSGLVGSALSAMLTTGGHTVVSLVRGDTGPEARRWDPLDPAEDLLEGVDAIVHLAGAPIAGRFSQSHKDAIYDSRVTPTRLLAQLAARSGVKSFVSASAIGIYGADRGDEELTETSGRGDGFLADVVDAWEAAADAAAGGDTRVVKVRTGIVQSPNGGALALLRPLFASGLGGRLGSGRQWMAWIGLDDLLDVYLHSLMDDAIDGPMNAVAPGAVRNTDYTATLAKVLHRPAVLPVPPIGPRVLLGAEGAREVAAASQRVLPTRLTTLGHPFRHSGLEACLRHCLGHMRED